MLGCNKYVFRISKTLGGYKKMNKQQEKQYKKIKEFVEGEEGNGCKLLSMKLYQLGQEKLEFLCACGNEFKTKV